MPSLQCFSFSIFQSPTALQWVISSGAVMGSFRITGMCLPISVTVPVLCSSLRTPVRSCLQEQLPLELWLGGGRAHIAISQKQSLALCPQHNLATTSPVGWILHGSSPREGSGSQEPVWVSRTPSALQDHLCSLSSSPKRKGGFNPVCEQEEKERGRN